MQSFMFRPAIQTRSLLLISICALCLPAAALTAAPSVSVNVGVEIETRGPVHEAFAEPVVYDPDPGTVVPNEPPPPIEEAPPEQRPEGDAVTWVPGYWGWDDERHDFIWVSGVWRVMPPGRQYVPGYWAKTPRGYQWVAGSWLSTKVQTLEYLPEPPPLQSVDPVGAPPATDSIWVPGIWVWRQDQYLWRPGYWIAPNPDWVWTPAHYIWSPSGYLYVGGYWDYAVKRRGVLFAPCYIERAVLTRPGFVYSPTVVIESDLLVDCLFVRAGVRHYYFGDYFAPEYARVGIVPVYTFQHSHHGYSALYAQTLALHIRTEPGWEKGFIHQYEVRRDHADQRPPRTWVAMERARTTIRPGHDEDRARVGFARPLNEVASARTSNFRFQKVDARQREDFTRGRSQLRDYQTQRSKLEQSWAEKSPLHTGAARADAHTPADRQVLNVRPTPPRPGTAPNVQPRERAAELPHAGEANHGQPATPRTAASSHSLRLNLPRSPVFSRQALPEAKTAAPPARPTAPKAEPAPGGKTEPGARPAPHVETRDREREHDRK